MSMKPTAAATRPAAGIWFVGAAFPVNRTGPAVEVVVMPWVVRTTVPQVSTVTVTVGPPTATTAVLV